MPQWLSELTLDTSYLSFSLVLGFAVLIAAYQTLLRKFKNLKKQVFQLQNEIRAITSGNLGMGRKISHFAEEIANVELTNLTQENDTVDGKTYQQAGLLLSRGATIEEVVDTCNIAPAEAELLAIMSHSGKRKSVVA